MPVVRHVDYRERLAESLRDPAADWRRASASLTWFHRPTTTLDVDLDNADVAWFAGGRLNAAVNCIDRHATRRPGKTALVWAKDEPGQYERISYRNLAHRVGQLANVLRTLGVQRGDRVAVYLPNVPEAVYAMLACARIGAVHVVVFSGFSAEAFRQRVLDSGAKVVITANEGLRAGRRIPLKASVDEAVGGISHVDHVLVARRTSSPVPMRSGRDLFLEEEMAKQRSTCPAAWMDAEDPLFISYTSAGRRGPKGVLHTTGGYLLHVTRTQYDVFGGGPERVHWCPSNVGCITGHSYIVYGPLSNGQTSVLFESTPTFPDPSRYWRVVEDLGVQSLFVATSALRQLQRAGDGWVRAYDRSRVEVVATLGEPVPADLAAWAHAIVGDGEVDVLDTWWHAETGGIVLVTVPEGAPTEAPAPALRPYYGVQPVLVAADGNPIDDELPAEAELGFATTWPGQARTLFGDHRRFRESFYSRHPGVFSTGDRAARDHDGRYRITEHADAFVNVSGYRLAAAEIEDALCSHDAVEESVVVPVTDSIEGQSICAYVILRPNGGAWAPEELVGALKEQVRHAIGPIATPDSILIVDELPRTRGGRVQRQQLRRRAEETIALDPRKEFRG